MIAQRRVAFFGQALLALLVISACGGKAKSAGTGAQATQSGTSMSGAQGREQGGDGDSAEDTTSNTSSSEVSACEKSCALHAECGVQVQGCVETCEWGLELGSPTCQDLLLQETACIGNLSTCEEFESYGVNRREDPNCGGAFASYCSRFSHVLLGLGKRVVLASPQC